MRNGHDLMEMRRPAGELTPELLNTSAWTDEMVALAASRSSTPRS
jgi:hypothetical protein